MGKGWMTPRELELLKREVSLSKVAGSQGYTLRKQGKGYVVLYPFHTVKTPSCVISPGKNLYHSFGCGAAGSVLDWVQKTESLIYPQILQRLRELAGSASSSSAAVPASPSVRSCPSVAWSYTLNFR